MTVEVPLARVPGLRAEGVQGSLLGGDLWLSRRRFTETVTLSIFDVGDLAAARAAVRDARYGGCAIGMGCWGGIGMAAPEIGDDAAVAGGAGGRDLRGGLIVRRQGRAQERVEWVDRLGHGSPPG